MTLPTGVGTGTINGRFVLGVIDSPYDEDNDPELIPAQGRITFVPNIPYDPYVPNTIDGVPMTILRASISGVLDSEGYLCTPDNTSASGLTRGVKLFSTDTGMVTNWTYTVKYNFSSVNNTTGIIPDHPLSVPNGSIQDLTTIVRVPSSPGVGIPQMESAVLRAESVARSVREDADAGVFDGEKGDLGPMGPPVALEIGTVSASAGNPADDDIMSTLILSGTKTQAAIKAQIPIEQIGEQGPKGDPGNTTMRVDTSVGTRVFITNGVTERMVSGDTKWALVNLAPVPGKHGGGSVRYRRRDDLVELQFQNILLIPGAGYIEIFSASDVPLGFRPVAQTRTMQGIGQTNNAVALQMITIFGSVGWLYQIAGGVVNNSRPEAGISGIVMYTTDDPWPTALPGTPA